METLPNRDLRNLIIDFIKSKGHSPRNDGGVYKSAFSCEDGVLLYLGRETNIACKKRDFDILKDVDWTYVAMQVK